RPIKPVPVDCVAATIQLTQARQDPFQVPISLVRKRTQPSVPLPTHSLPPERKQGAAGTNLDEIGSAETAHLADGLGKANRPQRMVAPIVGTDRFGHSRAK